MLAPGNIGTWNVRYMNQDKLDMVTEEIARLNINILGISELKWTGMGEYNSEDHYICYCGQRIPLKKLIRPHSQQKSLKRST